MSSKFNKIFPVIEITKLISVCMLDLTIRCIRWPGDGDWWVGETRSALCTPRIGRDRTSVCVCVAMSVCRYVSLCLLNGRGRTSEFRGHSIRKRCELRATHSWNMPCHVSSHGAHAEKKIEKLVFLYTPSSVKCYARLHYAACTALFEQDSLSHKIFHSDHHLH